MMLPYFWSLIAAVVLAIFDFPYVFSLIPRCPEIHQFCETHVTSTIKCFLYVILSLPCFLVTSFSTISGILLVITAVLFGFASINEYIDRRDASFARGRVVTEKTPSGQAYQRILNPLEQTKEETKATEIPKPQYGTY